MEILSENDAFSGFSCGPVIELKLFDGGEAGQFEGYASTFNQPDLGGDTILPGAYTDTLAKHAAAGTAPVMLWHHRMGSPVGKWLAMGEDGKGLRVRGKLNLETTAGRDAYAHSKAGDSTGLSIGYSVPPGGAKRQGGGRTLSKIDLHEVSLTPLPMDPQARIDSVKSAVLLTSRDDLEEILVKTGLARRAARKIAAGGWPALAGADDEIEAKALVDLIRAAKTEISTITTRT